LYLCSSCPEPRPLAPKIILFAFIKYISHISKANQEF
jgi:hypothetical protein